MLLAHVHGVMKDGRGGPEARRVVVLSTRRVTACHNGRLLGAPGLRHRRRRFRDTEVPNTIIHHALHADAHIYTQRSPRL